ncbi:MAG: hypothetical protein UT88_C0004G0032, partial [Candidatus Woesebacteria bacterium GW2011_GWD2_40_19]
MRPLSEKLYHKKKVSDRQNRPGESQKAPYNGLSVLKNAS